MLGILSPIRRRGAHRAHDIPATESMRGRTGMRRWQIRRARNIYEILWPICIHADMGGGLTARIYSMRRLDYRIASHRIHDKNVPLSLRCRREFRIVVFVCATKTVGS